MKTLLTVLLVLILAAEAIVWLQMRKRILGAAALVIFILRFVIFDLFPLFGG